MSRVLSLIEPVVVMAFGALLGLVDQTATETSGWLRVPALVASLLIVAIAIQDFQARRAEWITPPEPEVEPSNEVVVIHAEVDSPGRATFREAAAPPKVSAVSAVRENVRVIYFVMILSVWLGLATLANPSAPWPLLVLSLLAAFLLFAEAWQLLRSRR
jgi:hypothetical protein